MGIIMRFKEFLKEGLSKIPLPFPQKNRQGMLDMLQQDPKYFIQSQNK